MSQIFQLILRISSFWFLINILHICLTKLLGEKYNFFLSRNGIFVKFVQFQWHTKRFNSALTYGFVRSSSSKVAAWFTCGAYFGIIAMFSSILILIYTLVVSLVGGDDDTKVLTPVVPGVNLPANQIFPYLLTLLISGIFHEYGHAVAAAREDVSMYGAGLFLFLIYPAAFVDLNTEALKRCDPFQKLRIFCAGVWHNCVLMVAAYAVWHAMPFFLFFVGYTKQHAAVVNTVEYGSALENQLFPDAKIYSINNCPVFDKVSWEQCLWKVYETKTIGHCVDDEELAALKSKDNCCEEGVVSPRNICFQGPTTECLYARQVLKQPECYADGFCYTGKCFRPHEKEGYLLQIRHSSSDTKALFIGDPSHLYLTIVVSDYSSQYFWRQLPNEIELFMIYIVSLSGALAIFNAVPAFYLDGQHMLDAFLELVMGCSERASLRENISFAVQIFSTVLVGVNVVNAFVSVCVLYQ